MSTAETIDAARTVQAVGLEHRDLLRTALSQVLAKSADDKAKFAQCFDRFFTFETLPGVAATDDAAACPPAEESPPLDGLQAAGGQTGDGRGLRALLEAGDAVELEMRMAWAARSADLSKIRLFTQRGMFLRRILEGMGIDEFDDALIELLRRQDPLVQPEIDRLRELKAHLIEDVGALVERQMLMYTANSWPQLREEVLRKVPLTRVETRDFKVLQELVRKLAKRLVALHSRRRKVAHRGHLDVRHTIRRNIKYDGLLFDTVWKRIKVERPKVIAVCDVSGSVAQVARFLLLFLYSLTEVIPKVRAFAFSNKLAEVTTLFRDTPVEQAVQQTLREYGHGSTDYGAALAELAGLALDDIDHRTTVLILGDARSNYGDPGTDYLHEIHTRARRVFWLNPEPRSFWDTGDSEMRALGAACDRVESCRSLQHLERLVGELVRTAV